MGHANFILKKPSISKFTKMAISTIYYTTIVYYFVTYDEFG